MDLNTITISFVLGVVASLFAQPVWLVVSGVAEGLFSDIPKVSGKWTAAYQEPNAEGGMDAAVEEVNFRQLGRLVWGTAVRSDSDNDKFSYSGRLKRDVLVGTFQATGEYSATGRGAFQVIVSGDDQEMDGWTVWKDADTTKIEASKFEWRRMT